MLSQCQGSVYQATAGLHNAAVGAGQVFSGAVYYGAHAFLQRRVLNGNAVYAAVQLAGALLVAVHQVVVAFVGQGNKGSGHVLAVHAGTGIHGLYLVGRKCTGGVVVKAPSPAVFVVNGHPKMPVQGVVSPWRHHGEARHDPRCDAPVQVARLGLTAYTHQQAAFNLFDFKLGFEVAHVVVVAFGASEQGVGFERATVQKRHMAGVNAAL